MDKSYSTTKKHVLRLARTEEDDIYEEEMEFLESLQAKMEDFEGDSIDIHYLRSHTSRDDVAKSSIG